VAGPQLSQLNLSARLFPSTLHGILDALAHSTQEAFMTRLHLIACAALATVVVAGGMMSSQAEAKAKCVRAGGQATMITPDLAKFMATAALNNSISGMGAKAVGPVSMKCTGDMVMPTCTARQKACK
jgi:hypothetical protein